jgi:cytochrome c-type biogenesis protein CcmH
MLWLVILLFAVAMGYFLSRPFMVEGVASADSAASASAVARDQLSEIEREANEGVIDAAQAEAARLDIKRRLLKRLPAPLATARTLALIERKFLAGALAGGIGVCSLVLYGVNGSPDVPAVSRKGEPSQAAAQPQVPHTAGGPIGTAQPSAGAAPSLATVEEMIQKLAARLEKEPGDANGWRMLGWSHAGMGQFKEAAAAYTKAIALQPTVGALRTARGDTLVRAADGNVTPEAKADFEAALQMDAKDAQARYGLGLAQSQAGDKTSALETWVLALSHAGPNDTWAADLDGQVRTLAAELKVDLTGRLGAPTEPVAAAAGTLVPPGGVFATLPRKYPPSTSSTTPAPERGPTADDVKAADGMKPADRQAMIVGMVDGLQQRLDKDPRDADGWIKLIKSRQVLGQTDKAKEALSRATTVFADVPAERARIVAAALESGVTP